MKYRAGLFVVVFSAVFCLATASTLTITGTGTDVISWVCVGAK